MPDLTASPAMIGAPGNLHRAVLVLLLLCGGAVIVWFALATGVDEQPVSVRYERFFLITVAIAK